MSNNAVDLRKRVSWALRNGLSAAEVLPMLQALLSKSEPDSEDHFFAHQYIAEMALTISPWHAALSARAITKRYPDDDRGWAILGLAHTQLGNYRSAATAYRRALRVAPSNPWYAHNLGHILDIGLNLPHEGLTWLAKAHNAQPDEPEIGASYAHALSRVGEISRARSVLRQTLQNGGTDEQRDLMAWLESDDCKLPASQR